MSRCRVVHAIVVAWAVGTGVLLASACTAPPAIQAPDARLITHTAQLDEGTEAQREWIDGVVEAHERADEALAANKLNEAIGILRTALDQGESIHRATRGAAEVVQLDLAARVAELLLEAERAREAVMVIEPLVEPERSLPRDRASARAMVVLGDAARAEGDHVLAVGSYARALELMSRLARDRATEVLP